jgi:eukaryotic-like serine/threonine-protein kinase
VGAADPSRQLLGGRYALEEPLGRGGMATVYRGTDTVLGRAVAVKVLSEPLARDPSFVERFRREARAAAGLAHPGVVTVFDHGSEGGTHYIVMELIEGPTLAQLFARGPAGTSRTLAIGDAVLAALDAAHARGLVHRDVKPGNVMLTGAGEVKVMDFGIVRSLDAETLTGTGTVVGSASYLAPEQVRGLPTDGRSDLYALGCVLYEGLAGRPPFTGPSAVSVAHQHVSADPPPLSRLASVSSSVEAAVMRALAKDPEARYSDAREMRAALSAAAAPAGGEPAGRVGGEANGEANDEATRPIPTAEERSGGWAKLAATAIALALVSFLVGYALVRLSVV